MRVCRPFDPQGFISGCPVFASMSAPLHHMHMHAVYCFFLQDCMGGCFDSAPGAAGRTSPVTDLEYGPQDFFGVIEEMRCVF